MTNKSDNLLFDLQSDVLTLHNKLLKNLESEIKQSSVKKEEIQILEWISNNSDDPLERKTAQNMLKEKKQEIDYIENGRKMAEFIIKTKKIIEELIKVYDKPVKIDFMGLSNVNETFEKTKLTLEYINIAKRFFDILIKNDMKNNLLCDDCGIELLLDEDFEYICQNCGTLKRQFTSSTNYQENSRINISQRYVYDKKIHFIDSIKRFQAKQNTTLSPTIINSLKEKIKDYNLRMEDITKNHLYEFLQIIDHTEHYDDITLLYCIITGSKAPDISHLESKLNVMFDEIEKIYDRLKPNKRSNFLNSQFVLFKLLQLLDYSCGEEDFYILKTREKMLEHDIMWKKICQELQWNFIPTI